MLLTRAQERERGTHHHGATQGEDQERQQVVAEQHPASIVGV